jgi:hypothetical protein
MKLLLSVCVFFLLAQISIAQKNIIDDKKSPESKIETVDFCELIINPTKYEGKTVRTVAILAYGGEDFIVLYCPKCYLTGVIKPVFTASFELKTKRKVVNKLSVQKHSSGTVKVVLIGKLSTQRLFIDSVEKATYISKEYHFPDRLSSKVKQKVDCNEK